MNQIIKRADPEMKKMGLFDMKPKPEIITERSRVGTAR